MFHTQGKPGKIEIKATKPLETQRDLSLAYSPGVAAPVNAIAEDISTVYDYTSKGNIVAVISNGTAILGLGNLGAHASKPVMEGKSVLFKRFADIDSIDIEINNSDPNSIIETIKNILEINNSEENFIEIDSLTNEIQKRIIKKNPFCKICKNK